MTTDAQRAVARHPEWVLRLVAGISQYEELHGSGEFCMYRAMDLIPEDILQLARTAVEYGWIEEEEWR